MYFEKNDCFVSNQTTPHGRHSQENWRMAQVFLTCSATTTLNPQHLTTQ